jgi:uncharacterized protein
MDVTSGQTHDDDVRAVSAPDDVASSMADVLQLPPLKTDDAAVALDDGVTILPDGSHQRGAVVHLRVLGREIWFDIENHRVVRWRDADQGSDEPLPAPTESGHVCTSCATDQKDSLLRIQRKSEVEGTGAEQSYAVKHNAKGYSDDNNQIGCVELHLNDKCNFRCDYCYLKSAGIEYLENEMPRPIATKAIDFLLSHLSPGQYGIVKFFGGEPFLSYDLMRFIVDYGEAEAAQQNKRIGFTINTNGSLLNEERVAWITQHQIHIAMSIDGNKASNDQHRKYISGNGTFEPVMKKAKQFLQQTGYLHIRSTINDGSFELKNSIVEFSDLAPNKNVKVTTDWNLVGDRKVDAEGADQLIRDMEDLARLFVIKARAGEKMPYTNMMEPLFKSFYTVKTSYRCGAARTMVGISPKGTMYPCHRFVEVDGMEMGNVESGLNGAQRGEFIDNRVEFKKPCSECWVRYFCGGGCAFNNFFTNANIQDPNNVHCKLFRHQVRLSLYVYTELPELQRAKGEADHAKASRVEA